jgi:3-deoxy-manno-octulosonate cytidylyltransferase (CMP-KDO synthetase)
MSHTILGVIPARYASTRLPGKPLVDICGKPMIQHVYEAARRALPHVVVATDDQRVAEVVESFDGRVVMTGAHHVNGTSRCLEAWERTCATDGIDYDLVVNIQGDEPMLKPEVLTDLVACFDIPDTRFATLATPVREVHELENNSEVFVTFDQHQNALYFSRSVIPFLRDTPREDWLTQGKHFKHLGLYAYTPEALRQFSDLPPGRLEQLEFLEQLRWLEAGQALRVGITSYSSLPVDTPADLTRVRNLMCGQSF